MCPVTEWWLVRHGESTANLAADRAEAAGAETIAADFRDADVPLSELGHAQSEALATWVAQQQQRRPDTVVVSPYRRARQTASAALRLDDDPRLVTIDDRVRDRELGVLDLLTTTGVESRLPLEAARRRWHGRYYYRPPGGESWADVTLRLRQLFGELDREPDTDLGLVVTHAAVVTLAVALLLRWSEEELLAFDREHIVGNASVTRLSRDGESWRLIEFAGVDHLRRLDVPATEHPGSQDAAVH